MPTVKMSSSSTHAQAANKQFYLLTNVSTTKASDTEIDLHAESWKLPYSIDDSELTFDGKPLNLLYEENRSCHVKDKTAHEHKSRGRSRKSKK